MVEKSVSPWVAVHEVRAMDDSLALHAVPSLAMELQNFQLQTFPSAGLSQRDMAFLEGQNTQVSALNDFPEGGRKAWLVVFGSFCIITSTWGLGNSIGVFQAHWAENELKDFSSSELGWIGAVNIFFNLFLGVQVGPLFDTYGPKWILLAGSIGYVTSLFCMAQCSQYYQFMLSYGVLGGISSAALTTVAVSVIAHWFNTKRGQASGLCFIGSSFGGVMFPLILQPMLEKLGWAWTIRIVACMISALVGLGNLCIRGRLPPKKGGGTIQLRAFADARFSWATFGIAAFEFVLVGAMGLLPTFALYAGFNVQTSFYVVAVLNGSSAIGRYTAGLIADKWGRFNAMLLTLIVAMVGVLGFGIAMEGKVVLLYLYAATFGFGSGSVISLAPVCFGQLCKASQYGMYYGTGYSVVSFATLVCIPIGGALLPSIGIQATMAFFGGVLVFSLVCFTMARWACLDYSWRWKANI